MEQSSTASNGSGDSFASPSISGFIENNSQQLGTVFALQMINISPVQAGTVFAYRSKSL